VKHKVEAPVQASALTDLNAAVQSLEGAGA
jgi:hypothetical protein